MAAVGELVQWLKSHRPRRRKKEKNQLESCGSSTPKLATRSGMALPPVPPENWPDISRDCARSPYQTSEEISAYAIDSRLDIIRDTHIPFLKNDAERPPSCYQQVGQPQPSSATGSVPNGNSFQERTSNTHQIPKEKQKCQNRIPNKERIPPRNPATQQEPIKIPRVKTPWPTNQELQDSPASEASDQLDHWVPVQEQLDALTIHDHSSQPERVQDQRIHAPRNLHREHLQTRIPRREVKSQAFPHTYLSMSEQGPSLREHASCGDLDDLVFHEVGNLQSDDSGVMSPSQSPLGVVHEWSEQMEDTHHSNAIRSGNSGLSARSTRLYTYTPYPSTDDKPAATSTPTDLHRHDDHHDSTDTFNEYDGSETEGANSEHSAHLEYLFYLRKTEENLLKTRGVQNIARSACDVRQPHRGQSLNLTTGHELAVGPDSVPGEEVRNITKKHNRSEKTLPPKPSLKPRSSNEHGAGHSSRSRHHVSATSPRKAKQCATDSAFMPYKSKSLMQLCEKAAFEVPKNPEDMTLEERLSCRVTTGVPTALRTLSKTQTSRTKRARPVSSVVTMATVHAPNSSRNSALTDVMRMNQDRQIVSMY